jgi:NAD(P)-dependent dehydrogenase (short-subunit alcohol dehydrogenase family)
MTKGLAGKVVWITGASSGIGRALALEAASQGARVILSGRRSDALDEVAKECESRGGEAAAVLAFDLEVPAARAEACEAAPGLLGPIDVLVLNAGMSQRSTFLETASEVFDRVMNLDFTAQVDMVRRCLPSMVARGSGCLVAISSFVGLAGMPIRPAYSSAKHALAGLFQCLRAELLGTGVRVVTAYPGYVRTGVGRNALMGDGRPTNAADPHIDTGFEPAPVARRILRATLSGTTELKVAFDYRQRLGLFLCRYVPSVWASLSARHAGLGSPNPVSRRRGR